MANKRQRSDDNEPPDYHPAVVGVKISGSSTARQHPTRKNKTTSQMLIMPPLETIPSTLVDLQRIINMGGCPRCGHIDAGKCGKIKGGTVQKYRCKHCKCYYHECQNDYVRKEARLTPDVYQDHTLEGKQRVITLANHAYEQITKNEMNQDEKIFQQRIQVLYAQLVEKRRNVSKLLGIILPTVAVEEDNNDNDNSMQQTNNNNSGIDGETSEKKIDSTSNSTDSKEGGGEADTKSTSNNNNNNSVDPFRDAILLLRNETSKLEQRMFALQQRQDQMAKAGEEEEEVDILNDDNPPRTPMLLGANGGGGATYQLASKIVQEGGEEITIYEKKE